MSRRQTSTHDRGTYSRSDIPLLSLEGYDSPYILTPPPSARFSSYSLTSPPLDEHKGTFRGDEGDGIPLQSSYFNLNWFLFIVTMLCCAATSYFAYNATLENPNTTFIPVDPNWTIGILNALSMASAFLLSELVQAVFERTRWILASRPKGVLLTDFLGMSRATSIAGVLALLCWGKSKKSSRHFGSSRGNGKLWILQRIITFLLFAALRLVLLLHVQSTETFSPYLSKPVISGMSTFNATPALSTTTPDFIRKDVIQDFVLASFASFRVTTPENLIDCNDPTCVGLRIHDILEYTIAPPSNWSSNDPDPEYSATWKSEFDPQHDWDVFTVSNASTLQVEFSLLDSESFNSTDCQIYGYPYLAVQICLKQGVAPNVMSIAPSACVRIEESDCFTNTSWTSTQALNASLWQQYSSIAYSRKDDDILESLPVTANTPAAFDIDGLFQIYNAIYGLANLTDSSHITTNITATIRYHTVEQATAWLEGNVGIGGLGGDVDHYWSSFAVRSLVIVPLMDFTNPKTAEYLTTGSSAKQFYRLLIPKSSAYGFFGIVVVLIAWCGCCLLVCPRVLAPNCSLFPEIDFGSKCVSLEMKQSSTSRTFSTVGDALYPLSNATSKEVSRNLTGVSIYAGSTSTDSFDLPHVILATDRARINNLRKGVKYC